MRRQEERRPPHADVVRDGQTAQFERVATIDSDPTRFKARVCSHWIAGTKKKNSHQLQPPILLTHNTHRHILELKYAFKSANHVYVVTEACAGEELFDKIQASGAQSEADCQGIVRQLCRAVEYLHSNNVAHRNLKPENILLISGSNGEQTIKVTGFGSANVVAADVMLQTVAGTPDYVAPEVLRGEPYNESIDIWAIGVVTFILLCGYPPFYAKDLPTLYKQILEAKVTFDEHYWADVSDTAMHFIAKCLVLDSERRYSASECVADPWLDPNMLVAVSPTAATGVAKEHLRAYNAHRKDGKAEPYCPGDDESITNSEPDPLIKPSATQRGDFTQGATTAFYDIGDELGRGGCAIVYRCVEKTNGNVWALKRLIKADIDAVRLSREISIMKQLQHPSILRMKEAFDSHVRARQRICPPPRSPAARARTQEHIDLIMQLADGGELFDKIIAKGHFSEQEAAVTVCQLLEGLRYMHRKSIAHRDLKPENILVAGEEIKIADFGLSNIQGQQSRLMTPCGTPDYVAPEVLANKGYTLACDVWSAGVIAFIILVRHTKNRGGKNRTIFFNYSLTVWPSSFLGYDARWSLSQNHCWRVRLYVSRVGRRVGRRQRLYSPSDGGGHQEALHGRACAAAPVAGRRARRVARGAQRAASANQSGVANQFGRVQLEAARRVRLQTHAGRRGCVWRQKGCGQEDGRVRNGRSC